jgi:D-alanine-D-alanine ligase
MSDKINVALVYGGRSVEHDVSVISARNIQDNLNNHQFNLFRFGIDKQGTWHLVKEVSKDFSSGHPISLVLDASNPRIVDTELNEEIQIDVAFVILHGTDGEDGTIQGLFKMMQIPVVGSDVLGSAVAMNKKVSKKLLVNEGIPTAKCLFASKSGDQYDFDQIVSELGLPIIIKPANLGSSVGVSKVNSQREYQPALEEAYRYDTDILIEEYINGRELECSILGNNPPVASPPGEVELKSDYEFYSFDAKYVDGESCNLHIPANVPQELVSTIKEVCVKTFITLECADFARVDLFLKEDNSILINEINTLPGFTNISMYPKLCELMGISYSDLISRLINLALERYEEHRKLQTEYISGLS